MTHSSDYRMAGTSAVIEPRENGRKLPPLEISYFDPRTGEPSPTKCAPLHADGRAGVRRDESGNPASAVALERGTMAAQMREASKRGIEAMKKRRGYPGRPVEVDGRRYESQAEAATAEGFPRQALASLRSRSGAKVGETVAYRGHEVRWLA